MGDLGVIAFLAAGAGLYIWNLKRSAENLQYYPGNITGFSIDGVSPIVYTELVIQNTSNNEFTLNALSGNVTCDGTLVGNISNFSPVIIRPRSEGVLPITLKMFPIGLVNDIISAITGGVRGKVLEVVGSVNADGVQVPFSLSYKAGV